MCKVMEDMRREALQEGIKEGIKEGVKEGALTTAKRMLTAGKYALDEIVTVSGLSIEEVMQLQADMGV